MVHIIYWRTSASLHRQPRNNRLDMLGKEVNRRKTKHFRIDSLECAHPMGNGITYGVSITVQL